MSAIVKEFERVVDIPVVKTLMAGEDFIVLLDYFEFSKKRDFGNLFRLSEDGSLVWIISDAVDDVIVNVEWQADKLIAWTFGSRMLTIDPAKGTMIESALTK